MWEYIQETRDVVRDLEQRVRLSKANVELMRTIMAGWSQTPLYQRKEDKKDTLLYLEVCKPLLCHCMWKGDLFVQVYLVFPVYMYFVHGSIIE